MSAGREGPEPRRVPHPIATPEQTAREPEPFPRTSVSAPFESAHPDWRRRLVRNLSRRSTSRWEPLSQVMNLAQRRDD